MLVQMKEIKTKTYPLDQGFFLDVTTTCKMYEAWIYHKNYGTKEHIYGMNKKDIDYEKFLDTVEFTINADIQYYIEKHFDYEDKEKYYARKNNINQIK